jgi:inner membrane protein
MPSPVGHSIIGLALGAGFLLPRTTWRKLFHEVWNRRFLFLAILFLANLPDLDYLPGILVGDLHAYHHQFTHSLVFAVTLSAFTLVAWQRCRPPVTRTLTTLVYALLVSHLLADWMCQDGSEPYGIMWFWPFSERYTLAPWTPFLAPRKSTYQEMLQWYNVKVILVEAAWTLPLFVAVCWAKTRQKVVPAFKDDETS